MLRSSDKDILVNSLSQLIIIINLVNKVSHFWFFIYCEHNGNFAILSFADKNTGESSNF